FRSGKISPTEKPVVRRGETTAGKLLDIPNFVSKALVSRARSFILMLNPKDEHMYVAIDRMGGGPIHASVNLLCGTEQERKVRSFFTERGLAIPENSDVIPPVFHPGLPV